MLEQNKDFNQMVKEFEQVFDSGTYKGEIIRRTLTEKPSIRKAYGILLIKSPARLGEIKEKFPVTRRTIYSHLYNLIDLGLAKKIAVMNLWNKEEKLLTTEEKQVMEKFKEWTKAMSQGQLQNFAGKTNYFILTEVGRDLKNVAWALNLEKERRIAENA